MTKANAIYYVCPTTARCWRVDESGSVDVRHPSEPDFQPSLASAYTLASDPALKRYDSEPPRTL
jgi:hypothetical protein